jgi:hypothetical protein
MICTVDEAVDTLARQMLVDLIAYGTPTPTVVQRVDHWLHYPRRPTKQTFLGVQFDTDPWAVR